MSTRILQRKRIFEDENMQNDFAQFKFLQVLFFICGKSLKNDCMQPILLQRIIQKKEKNLQLARFWTINTAENHDGVSHLFLKHMVRQY